MSQMREEDKIITFLNKFVNGAFRKTSKATVGQDLWPVCEFLQVVLFKFKNWTASIYNRMVSVHATTGFF